MTRIIEKDKFVQIRMSAADKKALQKKATDCGMTVTELITQAVKKTKIWSPGVKKIQQEKIREIAKIGNNLNQIAKFCNIHKLAAETSQIIQILVAIERELEKVLR